MKRLFSVLTIGLLLMVLAACAAPAPTPVPPPPTTAPAAPTAAAAQPTSAPAQPTAAAATKAPSASGPIKIGMMAPATGNAAASGQDMLDGWNLYWKNNPTAIAGREVQFFVEDDAGNPDTALTKARLLIEQRGVHMIVGNLVASTGLAIAEYVKGNGVPYVIPVIAADDLTQRTRIPNVIRLAGWTSSQTTHPFGEWAFKQGYKRMATIAEDYAFGHESIGGFVHTYTDAGGTVVGQIWNPLSAPDFSSYLAQLQSLNPDAVFVEQTGADSVRFVKQWGEFGLGQKIALLGNETLVDQSLLRNMGPEAVGIVSAGHFAEGRNSPLTQDFVNAFDKAYGRLPSYYAADMYTAASLIAPAIAKVNGNVEDKKALVDAIRSVTAVDTPMGPEKNDEYGNPVMTVYLRKVEKRPDGRMWNTVTSTFENVSQFWKFDPATYLKQPVYSRDYQPGVKK